VHADEAALRAILHRRGKPVDLALAVDEARQSKLEAAEASGEPAAACARCGTKEGRVMTAGCTR
jgi:hypothetical protein